MVTNQDIQQAMHIRFEDVFDEMPEPAVFEDGIRRAPRRNVRLFDHLAPCPYRAAGPARQPDRDAGGAGEG